MLNTEKELKSVNRFENLLNFKIVNINFKMLTSAAFSEFVLFYFFLKTV